VSWLLRLVLLVVCASLFAAGAPTPAHAHPLGNFSLNHHSTLTVRANEIVIDYTIDYAEIPTLQLTPSIDLNGDGALSSDEQTRFRDAKTAELARGLSLTIDGAVTPLTVEPGDMAFEPGQSGLNTLRMSARFRATTALREGARVMYADNNEPERLGWREIIARGDGVALANSTVPATDRSDRLRTYPSDLLNAPLRVRSGAFTIGAQTGIAADQTSAATETRAFGTSRFDALFARYLNIDLGAAALLAALALGALHALEPGHGKSLAAAYLVGARATPGHALLLGASVTLTHTLSVIAMALVSLLLSRFVLPERLFPVLGLASAGIAIALGLSMAWQALQQLQRPPADHTHTGDSAQLHTHGGAAHRHGSGRSALAIGVSGGLVPCPAALIVLLSAIAAGQAAFGLLLVIVFSIGLALVLSAVCLGVVYGKRAAAARGLTLAGRAPGLARWLPLLSAAIVLAAGLYVLLTVIAYFVGP
jgi:nickel/cobalt transporter (NicO) family protein